MSLNKDTVPKYIEGFNRSDHAQILSCLTDDIEWLRPGAFHLTGKDAFDKEIENDAFTGSPTVKISSQLPSRLVRARRPNSGIWAARW
jgi:ketosteroid isomerase-like protein